MTTNTDFAPELSKPTTFKHTSVGRGEGAQNYFQLDIAVFKQNDSRWLAHIENLQVIGQGETPADALKNAWLHYEKVIGA